MCTERRIQATREDSERMIAAVFAELNVTQDGMLEVEFLDEPDPNQRFFRLGSDPTRMVAPIRLIDLNRN